MSGDCQFCRILRGEVAEHFVHEDSQLVAFLDRSPIRPGHTQIVPKAHYAYFDEAPAEVVASIALLGQKLAVAMKRVYRVPRVGFAFTGGDIAHVHGHVLPLVENTDITSRRYIVEQSLTFCRLPCPPEDELAATAAELGRALAAVETK
jgi:histidine triad (HIT) family protein